MFDHFDFIPTDNLDKPVQTGHCICKHCGQRVETGIINLSTHWSECWGKTEWEQVKKAPKLYLDKKKLEVIFNNIDNE